MAILVKGHNFADGDQVTSTKLDNLVDLATFAAGAVDASTITLHASGYMQVGTIQTGNIAAASVTTAKLADSTGATDGVTTAKLATGAVTTAKITDSNVTTAKIADSNVTTAKIADANITAPKLSGAQTGTAPIYAPRAWVTFDMTRNAAGGSDTANTTRYLIASGNVMSVTKSATGEVTVAFTTALPAATYAYVGSGTGTSSADELIVYRKFGGTKSTSAFDIKMTDAAGTAKNFPEVTLIVMG